MGALIQQRISKCDDSDTKLQQSWVSSMSQYASAIPGLQHPVALIFLPSYPVFLDKGPGGQRRKYKRNPTHWALMLIVFQALHSSV